MAASSRSAPPASSGCLFKLGALFVAGTVIGVAASLYFVTQPQSLDDIDGLDPATAQRGRDVSTVLTESVERQTPGHLSEAEINQWLARTLTAKQGGRLAEHVEFKRVAVRLTDGLAEVIMDREIAGRTFTHSVFVTIHQETEGNALRTELNIHGGRYAPWLPFPPRGGRFGSLVVPQGFLRLIMPAYTSMVDQLEPEVSKFTTMTTLRIVDKKLEFDPRLPTKQLGGGNR